MASGGPSDEDRPSQHRRSPGALRTTVLAALVEQPGHGYDLTNRINRRLSPGLHVDARRVYEVLEQLEKEGLACCAEEQITDAPHRGRRVFAATERGRRMHEQILSERQPVALPRMNIHALVAFSAPEHAPALLSTLETYEKDCIQTQERALQGDNNSSTWRGRMIAATRAAAAEQLAAELRWIALERREIEAYLAAAR